MNNMNDRSEDNESIPALDPWINVGPVNDETLFTMDNQRKVKEDKSKLKKVVTNNNLSLSYNDRIKNQAELIKICQDEVLKRWSIGVDSLGRSTAWKTRAALEDIKNKVTDSSIMDQLAKEVSELMERHF